VNTLVQGSWALLLSRYSGQPDVVFGATVSGRPAELPGVENMIGMFINTVPTRVTINHHQDTITWLRQLQTEQVESRRYDFVSLAQLQTWSDLPPATNLFNSAVVFENYPFNEATITDNNLHIREIQAVDTTNFPLALSAHLDKQLRFALAYDPTLFDVTTAQRMIRHLLMLLQGIVAKPDQSLAELPMLAEAERHWVLEACRSRWRGSRTRLPWCVDKDS
jgi:non-ribosomal peptide synthetase component F